MLLCAAPPPEFTVCVCAPAEAAVCVCAPAEVVVCVCAPEEAAVAAGIEWVCAAAEGRALFGFPVALPDMLS